MPLVIDTYNDYFFYLQYRRNVVDHTIKANRLALQYFAQLYGQMETEKLLPTHLIRFHEFLLQRKRLQKNEHGEYLPLSRYTIYKVMVKLRAYIKRLESERMLWDLKPIDVPVWGIPRPFPKYLSKEELKTITEYLETNVAEQNERQHKEHVYNAQLYRALVRFLYTTGLRNNELRTLRLHDLNIHEHRGQVLGKWNKYGAITFSDKAKEHLLSYLEQRHVSFPDTNFEYLFTPYSYNPKAIFTMQSLNRLLKDIGKSAWVEAKTNTHVFRHSLATHMIQSWFPISVVRDKLRHSSLTVTNGYVRSNPLEQLSATKSIDSILV